MPLTVPMQQLLSLGRCGVSYAMPFSQVGPRSAPLSVAWFVWDKDAPSTIGYKARYS